MDRSPKPQDVNRSSPPVEESPGEPCGETRKRQAAASYLSVARLTDDAADRKSLRRQAAELLSPRGGNGQDHAGTTSDPGCRPKECAEGPSLP